VCGRHGSFGTSLLQEDFREDCREDLSGSQAKVPNNGANCGNIARSGFIENGFGNWAGRVQLVGCFSWVLFETSSRIQRLQNIVPVLCRFAGTDGHFPSFNSYCSTVFRFIGHIPHHTHVLMN
jgi:hypothetical protein